MNQPEIQKKYYESNKGQAKLRRQNEKRRNQTKFKKVIEQINYVAMLCMYLSDTGIPVRFKAGKQLRFICEIEGTGEDLNDVS